MKIENTEPRLITLFVAADKAPVKLVPGFNDVADDVWEILKKHDGVRNMAQAGMIKVGTAEPARLAGFDDAPAPKKRGRPRKEDAAPDADAMAEAEALLNDDVG